VRESTASPAQNYEVKTRLLDVAQYLSRRNSFGHLGRLHPDSGFLRRATDPILAIVEEFIVQRLRYLYLHTYDLERISIQLPSKPYRLPYGVGGCRRSVNGRQYSSVHAYHPSKFAPHAPRDIGIIALEQNVARQRAKGWVAN
jgi:hypothetical protein